jgi:formylglycine-generating enzyme required for sulfatase activity
MIHVRIKHAIILFMLLNLPATARDGTHQIPKGMSFISGGIYKPLYGVKSNSTEIKVAPFYIDKYPVTNEEFLRFVKENPQWRKSKVKKFFADQNYLRNWKSDLELGSYALPSSPVTDVSWFAAKAYSEYYGKRLPTVAEWELVGSASAHNGDGYQDPSYVKQILEWYSKPTLEVIPPVGRGTKNYWGVFDMHGLVWEWTSDFFNALVSGESRGDSGLERNLFCGSGSVSATDFKNYPAFMRFAFRSSLKANYTTSNLGFRCVKDY